MVEVEWLKRRIQAALAAAPLVVAPFAAGACAPDAGANQPVAPASAASSPAPLAAADPAPPAPPAPADAPPPPPPRRERLPGPSCPSGDWCGTVKLAKPFAIKPFSKGAPAKELGCPTTLDGSARKGAKPDPKKYEGLPLGTPWFASLDAESTKEARKKVKDACCYDWTIRCPGGRPLRLGDTAITASVIRAAGWDEPMAGLADPGDQRLDLIERWLADALSEHASIASFERAARELEAVDAPAALVAATRDAADDEVRHARLCFGLASAYAGEPLGPGPLTPPPDRAANLVRLAVDTFVEGCVGESVAAAAVQRAATRCADPVVAAALQSIADDEARHAALAWRTVAWAVQRGGEPVVVALGDEAAARRPSRPAPVDDGADDALAAYGRLSEVEEALVTQVVWERVIWPTLGSLVSVPLAPSVHA